MFESLLIANRGEIARRIIRTAKRLGIRTIAVYSDADANAPHVCEYDEAVRIGPASARESYLRVDAIFEAARGSGAEAIHPGYGFLSEKPELPRACAKAGIAFVGPPAEVVEAMGSKIAAKRLAVAAKVPVVPGFEGDTGDDGALIAAGAAVGFPLLVKASAGGGGKGMRVVARQAEFADALAAARREARAAFGDDKVLLERFVGAARHVEVQIAADHYGTVLHLFERDCSVQRNNQKVFEEAPAPNLDSAVRRRLLDDAVRLAASIGYRNLGTMEFLVDASTGETFFLEMNTRLQVEHPVTEMITGLDLVELQLRIAAGEAMPFAQEDLRASGHAIEARIAAERPEAGFAPAIGRIALWRAPTADGVRVDAGVESGSEVTVHYDSMIAKVIAHGATREEARARLARALDGLVALGPATNRAFLAEVARFGDFADGRATTATLAKAYPDGWSRPQLPPALAAGIAAALHAHAARKAGPSPWSTLAGFRVLAPAGRLGAQDFTVEIGDMRENARLRFDGPALAIVLGGETLPVHIAAAADGFTFTLASDARRGVAARDGDHLAIRFGDAEFAARVRTALEAHEPAGAKAGGADVLRAPMPGIVVEVKAAVGEAIEAGAPAIVIESMKLFQTLAAPRAGRIARIDAEVGQSVPAGHALVTLEPERDGD